ncbi:unnamed protein product, partial [Adineta steineri]
ITVELRAAAATFD